MYRIVTKIALIYRKRRKFAGTIKSLANCDISPTLFANIIIVNIIDYYIVYGLIHVPLHLRILNHYTCMASILKYFKLAKLSDDHLPDPEGTLSSKLLVSYGQTLFAQTLID